MANNNPICVACSRAFEMIVRFEPKKNGIIVPYGLNGARHADLWECPECHHQIVMGFGDPAWHPEVKKKMLESDLNILKGIVDS